MPGSMGALASFPGRVGETAWQLPRVQTVYGCDVKIIVQPTHDQWILE